MHADIKAARSEQDDDPIAIRLELTARRELTYAEIKETVVQVAMLLVDEAHIAEICGQLAQTQRFGPPARPRRVK